MAELNTPSIPYDMYESPQEVVIIIPLWWVKKESVEVKIENYRIQVKWFRLAPQLPMTYWTRNRNSSSSLFWQNS